MGRVLASRVRPEVEMGNRQAALHERRAPGGQVREKGEVGLDSPWGQIVSGDKKIPLPQ